MDDLALEAFQQALLTILAEEKDPEAVFQALRDHPALAPYRDYVEQWEPRLLEVAAQLVRRWGRRGQDQGV